MSRSRFKMQMTDYIHLLSPVPYFSCFIYLFIHFFYVGKLVTQWCHSCLWFCLPKSPRPSGPPGASHPPTPNSAQHPGEASQARDAAWGAETWTVCPGKECTRLPINRHTWDRPHCRMSTGMERQQHNVPRDPHTPQTQSHGYGHLICVSVVSMMELMLWPLLIPTR